MGIWSFACENENRPWKIKIGASLTFDSLNSDVFPSIQRSPLREVFQ